MGRMALFRDLRVLTDGGQSFHNPTLEMLIRFQNMFIRIGHYLLQLGVLGLSLPYTILTHCYRIVRTIQSVISCSSKNSQPWLDRDER
jgi:hypothetical protein